MRALLLALSLTVLATAGPVVAYQPQEEYPPSEQPRSDRGDRGGQARGGRCRSEAEKKETAESFCDDQLGCSDNGKTVSCSGQTNRWVCVCA